MPVYVKQGRADRSAGAPDPVVRDTVARVIDDIRSRGDAAVREYSSTFDGWSPDSFRLGTDAIADIVATVPGEVLDDIRTVQENVRVFARHQRDSLRDFEVETAPGVLLGQRSLPVVASGAYVPGGRYPLVASAHMTVVTAKVAGVERVAACTPPIRGEVPAATVAAMYLAGADEIYLLGGVQAVAAMAIGTETIDPVDVLAGPGNAYVAEAKRQLYGEVGIDLLAGPTEILVIADDRADPFIVAVDLLSQAEHGPDSPAVLVTTSETLARTVIDHVERLLPGMPTRDFAEQAWRDHGEVIVVHDLAEAYAVADEYASEHVEVLTQRPREALDVMRHYGALFLGEGTCVSYGDKAIGTNHTLPTRRTARHTGGLWVGKYLRTVTYQEVTDERSSAELGRLCGRASRVELFEGHARSGDARVAKYDGGALRWAPGESWETGSASVTGAH
jgi:sulfopropanediol 3-dehydrogenase